MWRLQPPACAGPAGESRKGRHMNNLGLKLNSVDLHIQKIHLREKSGGVHNCFINLDAQNGELCKAVMKWDRRESRVSHEHDQDAVLQKFHDPIADDADELNQARKRISKLKADRRATRKKLDQFLQSLTEEKAAWRAKEHEKVRNILDAMKADLSRETKNRQRIEIVNSKLVSELSEAKSSAKRYLQDCEKERKARELMEEVCDELAQEIAEDKAEVEALKTELAKVREEMEEERKMLQMAEVWREERVQMKLIDAKVALDGMHSQLHKLQDDLDGFLSRHGGCAELEVLKEAEKLRKAIGYAVKNGVKELTYQPPPDSEDVFAVFEELKQRDDNDERKIIGTSPTDGVSPRTDVFLEKLVNRSPNHTQRRNHDLEDDSCWETVSHLDEQGSSNSLQGSEPSVNGYNGRMADCDNSNAEYYKSNSETSEVCSTTAGKPRKHRSSFSRLWRSANGNNHKKAREGGEIGDCIAAAASMSPSVGQQCSLDRSSTITRGTNGGAEFIRTWQSKMSDLKAENNKVQLRQALMQKI